MESAFRTAQWFVFALACLLWLGALAFAGFRIHQMSTLPAVSAEILDAKTEGYMARGYAKDVTGHTYETRSQMYAATAVVRYTYQGREYTAEARHDVGASWAWFQDRLTRQWKPGTRIRVHLDPASPDQPLAGLGFNLNTFSPSLALLFAGLLLAAVAYGLGRLGAFLAPFLEGLHRAA